MVKDVFKLGMSVVLGLVLAAPFVNVARAADADGDGFDDVTGAAVGGGH
jgi:hypothetical protein